MKLIDCMTREFLKMLNQYAVDYLTFPVNQRFFPPHPDPGGMLCRSGRMPRRKEGPPCTWDTHGMSGNVFANPGRLLHYLIQDKDSIRGFLT